MITSVDVDVVGAGGVRLACHDSGGDGPVLVLLHGLCGHSGEWDRMAAALPGHRLIAFDQRGNGFSERRPADLSRAAHAADVVAVLDAFDVDRAVLVGQSMGGDTAMTTAARHPDRVSGLVLVEAGPHDPDPSGGAGVITWMNSWPRPFPTREAAVDFLGGGPVGEGWADGLEQRDGGWWPRFDVDVMTRVVTADPDRDQWAEWARVRCPVLAVFGQKGIISTDRGHLMLTRRPTTEAVSVPGAGHDVHLEQPELVAALVASHR